MPAVSTSADPLWTALRAEAWSEADQDPYLNLYLARGVLKMRSLETALAQVLAHKLSTECMDPALLQSRIDEVFARMEIGLAIRKDLQAVRDRDPAAAGYLAPFLFFKGFQALQSYRVAHQLWTQGRQLLAIHLQNRISEVFGVDIHPAAQLGCGILMDHATGIVIGETAVIEDNVSLLHDVTLGGTGKETGDRHPKIRQGVLLGTGAIILGNVEIGEGAKVGAGSVVLDPVPPHCTVAGVPARIIGRGSQTVPALDMEQRFPHEFADGAGV